jgi:type IX secretion system PorP/SprF family membrane protein
MRHLLITIVLILIAMAGRGQQMPLYSQYMMNGYLINPAIAGSDGFTSFNLTAREQWLGMQDAPHTRSFSGQTRLLKRSYVIKSRNVNNRQLKPSTKGRVGLGGSFYYDKNGAIERTGMNGSYAYHIFMKDIQLSFGLSGGLYQFKVNVDKEDFLDQDDPMIAEGINRVLYIPDANVGFYMLSRRYQLGFSVNQLFQSYLKFGNHDNSSQYKSYRHYYIMGGYVFPLGNGDFELEPSVLFKGTEKLAFQTDFTAKLLYKQDYWFGTTCRTDGTMIALAGIRFNQLYFGYSFDYTLSSIRKYSWGSHEIVIALKFGDSARRYRWLNRY